MSSIRQLWWRWKTLRLPWRKKFLIGQDLNGNTYWEFKDALSHDRMRRIVKARRGIHHSDVHVSPQWHQWLRQTRLEPPSLQEQQNDVTRQIQLKHNAKLADERWAAKAKYIEKPRESPAAAAPVANDPWEQDRQKQKDTASNPGGVWQPETWTPGMKR